MANRPSDPSAVPIDLSKSELKVLGLVFRRRTMTQSTLVEEMELTQQSVSRLVSGLTERRMLTQGERLSAGKRGYPSTTLRLSPDFACSAGVAIMADAVGLALIDFSGEVLCERTASLPAMTHDAVLGWVENTLAEMRADHAPRTRNLVGVGVSVAGSFIGEAVGFNTPLYLDHWAGVDVAAIFHERLRLHAWADNDGNAAALAESINGVGRWANNFAYLYLSAGVGGGVILDGVPWRGRSGNAGEFAGGLPPNIYPFPNLELLRQILARDRPAFDTVLAMVQQYDPTWPAIEDWIARVRDSVSIIASNATAILDLDAIVFGGLMPKDLAQRLIACVELFDQKRRGQRRPTAKLAPSEVMGNAAAIGAAMLPLRAIYFR